MPQLDWTQSAFYGGFSNDKLIGIKNSFRYAKGVEIRKNPGSLTLAFKPEAQTIAVTGKVRKMVTIQSTGDIIAFCSDGKIFRNATGAGTWALVYTDTGGDNIMNAIEYNAYLYWFTFNKVHRIAIANIDASWSGDVTEDYKAFTNGNTNSHPAIEFANKLYIGDGKNLAELDSLGTFTGDKLAIFGDEEIRSITTDGTWIISYSRRSNKIDFGQKYFWNGTSATWQERKPINQMIHCAIEANDGDYVVAGQKPYLYLSKGITFQKLKRLPLVTGSQKITLSSNALAYTTDDILAIGIAESGTADIGRGVWTYGREDNNYPDSLNFDYPTSNDTTTDIVDCVHLSNGELYFSWHKVGDTYGIDKVNRAKYATTGSLHSRVFYADKAKKEKEIEEMSAAFNALATGEKIEIYLRKDLATSWPATAEITVDYNNDEDDRSIYHKEQSEALNIGNFNFLETKIVLTAGTSQATTPELTELSMVVDNEIELSDV